MSKFSDIAAAFDARAKLAVSRVGKMELSSDVDDALAELTRLRELNTELVETLREAHPWMHNVVILKRIDRVLAKARAIPPAHNPMSEAMRPDDTIPDDPNF